MISASPTPSQLGFVVLGMAIGAAIMLAIILFLGWVLVSMGRVWGARGAKRTGVAWGYVDSELSRILGIQKHGYTEERTRLKRELQELLYEVANKAAKEGSGRDESNTRRVRAGESNV